MSSLNSEEDAALSAALGWPGGISEPLLDRAALLRLVATATVELASMRRCFEAADRERSELRARAERAEAERDALRAALELYRGQVDQTGRHSAAEAIDRAVQALGARETERDALRVVQPSAFDPVAAMRLADDYAFAQSKLDGKHSTSRKYYVDSRDEARTALAAYVGIKEAK